MTKFNSTGLSSAAIEVLMQLFVSGPTWDGNIISKAGRGDLVSVGLAFHDNGWASLNPEGVRIAVEWDRDELSRWHDQRWIKKLRSA